MSGPLLELLHGWGLGPWIWDGVVAALGPVRAHAADRGYFGRHEPVGEGTPGPVIAVGHSLGAFHFLDALPPGCVGLVAINGFDRFATAGHDPTAVSRRIVDLMARRFEEIPDQVLLDFLEKCGSHERLPLQLRVDILMEDLKLLRDGDRRAIAADLDVPVLVLQGTADPILPPPMREAVFGGAVDVERHDHAAHGHLLPVTAPEWCAAHIRAFAARLNVPL